MVRVSDEIITKKSGVCRDEMRELDRTAIEDYAIPGVLLMENAGRNVAEEVMSVLRNSSNKNVAIICGKGNNGGDGFVIARHLYNNGFDVKLFLLAKVSDILGDGDAGLNLNILEKMKIDINEILDSADVDTMMSEINNCSLIVDAIFGTGLKGELREPAKSIIVRINDLPIPVISVDIPSGLDCNEGKALGACIKAKKTVTFAFAKKGFFVADGPGYVGELIVTDISIPKELMIG